LRLTRWRLKLEEYEYEVHYKPGAINTNADALSRIHVTTRAQAEQLESKDFERNVNSSQDEVSAETQEVQELLHYQAIHTIYYNVCPLRYTTIIIK
jgi:hypothetical protein